MTVRKAATTSAANGIADVPSIASPVSVAGLRVRLFLAKDVPDLVSKAGRPLAKGAGPGQIAQRLNLAFSDAYMAAEEVRVTLAPADLEGVCNTVAKRAGQLLRALQLPSDPRSYTREGIFRRHAIVGEPFRTSPLAHRLRRAVLDLEPLPSVLDGKVGKASRTGSAARVHRAFLSSEKAPLTEKMIPAGIAERTLTTDLYSTLIHVQPGLTETQEMSVAQIEAGRAVGLLLEMAPGAVALIRSLAMLVGKQAKQARARQAARQRRDGKPAGPRKPNYGRSFRSVLFYWLASAYWHSFRREPNIVDNNSEPGPATDWLDRILALAAQRCERITAIRVPRRGPIAGQALTDESERQRLIREIRATALLKRSTKASVSAKNGACSAIAFQITPAPNSRKWVSPSLT